jgi:hypothetical protein
MEPLVDIGNVRFGEVGGHGQIDLRFQAFDHRFAFHLGNSLLHQFEKHIIADGGDMAGLGGTQDGTAAADFQIVHGNLEPGSQDHCAP